MPYITRKCPNCGHVVKMMKADQPRAQVESVHVFANDAPFLEPGAGHTLRLVTPGISELLYNPILKSIAVIFPLSVGILVSTQFYLYVRYMRTMTLADLLPFAPSVFYMVAFPLAMKRFSRFWTWSNPVVPAEPESPDDTELSEPEQPTLHIERHTDHVPCWEYTIGAGHERQLMRYFPPEYRDNRGNMHHVDIPKMRSFAAVIVGRRFEWVDATRDETMRIDRAQYNAIRDDWLGQGWIETTGDRKKRVLQQAPIHMIAEREPR